MPNTARQRWVIEATWNAASTEPDSYTLKRLAAEGHAVNDGESVQALDLSDAALMAVIFPASIDAGAITLKFKDAAFANGTYVIAQDADGDDIAVTGVQDSKSRSRTINAEICTRLFAKPFFVDSGDSAITPGAAAAVTVTFVIKE